MYRASFSLLPILLQYRKLELILEATIEKRIFAMKTNSFLRYRNETTITTINFNEAFFFFFYIFNRVFIVSSFNPLNLAFPFWLQPCLTLMVWQQCNIFLMDDIYPKLFGRPNFSLHYSKMNIYLLQLKITLIMIMFCLF